jgi:hypothetical protein
MIRVAFDLTHLGEDVAMSTPEWLSGSSGLAIRCST